MVFLALLPVFIVIWLIWTKMANWASVDPPEGLETEHPSPNQQLAAEAQDVLPDTSSLQPPEASGTQFPPVEPIQAYAVPSQQPPLSSQPPTGTSKQSDHPVCQGKPPIPPSASDSMMQQPQGSVMMDPPKPLNQAILASSNPSLRQMRSLSLEEVEINQAQLKRQAMAKFVLGSFEDNSSDDEFMAGSFRLSGRRRSSLASIGSSSSIDLSSLLEAGSSVTMRCGSFWFGGLGLGFDPVGTHLGLPDFFKKEM